MANITEGKWRQFKGDIKKKWGKLTDDDIERSEGSRQKLVGRIQEAYGKTRAEVEEEVKSFFDRMSKRRDRSKRPS